MVGSSVKSKYYWSIQHRLAWEQAQQVGYLRGSEIAVEGENWFFKDPYQWMAQQMRQRIPSLAQDPSFVYPVWMWPARPDLRRTQFRGWGEDLVLLRLSVAPDLVLESDINVWTWSVLNNFRVYGPGEEDHHIGLEQSWQRVFDLPYLRANAEWFGELEIQCTTGPVPVENIRFVRSMRPVSSLQA
jgi:Domain of unknown function (DUF3841)